VAACTAAGCKSGVKSAIDYSVIDKESTMAAAALDIGSKRIVFDTKRAPEDRTILHFFDSQSYVISWE